MTQILASYNIIVSKSVVFVAIFPMTLLLSLIRTLSRLAVASLLANLLQFAGLALIIEYLSRDLSHVDMSQRDKFRPISEMALGFGSTMFAFEGISVVLPIYSRMKQPKHMASRCGVINVSFFVILVLYYVMGLLSYLKYGHHVRDSITLNLPAEPLYDAVRAMFTASILLSYPLQFYVPNEMIWKWTKKNLLSPPSPLTIDMTNTTTTITKGQDGLAYARALETAVPGIKCKSLDESKTIVQLEATNLQIAKANGGSILNEFITAKGANDRNKASMNVEKLIKTLESRKENASSGHVVDQYGRYRSIEHLVRDDSLNMASTSDGSDVSSLDTEQPDTLLRYEYCCRITIVVMTFTLAVSVPKLNLLMDLIGSFSGAALSLTIPALIHLAVFWNDKKGFSKCAMIVFDSLIIVSSLMAGLGGSLSSVVSIIHGH